MTTTGEQLSRWCLNAKVEGFLGTFAANQLPQHISPPACLIVNYSKLSTPGTHWVAMMFSKGGVGFYFDSMGLPPDKADMIIDRKTDFREYMLRFCKTLRWNAREVQELNSDVCGEYCAWCVRFGPPNRSGAKGEVSNPLWGWLSPDLHQNDKIIRDLFDTVHDSGTKYGWKLTPREAGPTTDPDPPESVPAVHPAESQHYRHPRDHPQGHQ